ncbi:MAG: hypothetical protein AVDCRST_MAG93-258 [uncultured Chloroflexia bacterium]|uniref:DUF262 domain-containing protein n=1 Tax=uncultured Chloroflexia bacterium TaxID=1672391 RepID=A0A6J4H942_9CHLR|nr:MAG: hypothetical protein AVDCRST_MAG93-258 [uncultured Chloroflexia bacterium]
MKEILGEAKTVGELLGNARYDVDYYQREYRWGTKQVQELLEDLAEKFLDDFDKSHEPEAVEGYGHYFLGSVVISRKEARDFIVDGQQRLTTLTLLLIYLHHRLRDEVNDEDAATVSNLIFSKKRGRKSFTLDFEERIAAMEALFKGEPLDTEGQPESVRNLVARYNDIEERFPEEIPEEQIGDKLPYFVDWLIEKVHLVEITAYSDEDAYAVFATMNDRGLSLTPTEMLRGYLLANISDEVKRNAASNVWKDRIAKLADLGKEEDADFFKSWLRSQYARKIRERKKDANPEDFDLIASEYHRWVDNNRDLLGLHVSADFDRLVRRDLDFFARQYRRLRLATRDYTTELTDVYHNAQLGFTLQYPVLLAPLTSDDAGTPDLKRKVRVVAAYLDILLARRLWNFRSIAYNTMQYAMFLIMRTIRSKNPQELATLLRSRLEADSETFASNDNLRMHQQNRQAIHYLLARITDHVERSSDYPSRFVEYMTRSGKNGYEIEHVWADKPERHTDEFSHPADFHEYRNRIGDLLLLPKSFNASYGDLPYKDKLPHYNGQNLLARSLHPAGYDHNPGFSRYIERSGLPFARELQARRPRRTARPLPQDSRGGMGPCSPGSGSCDLVSLPAS